MVAGRTSVCIFDECLAPRSYHSVPAQKETHEMHRLSETEGVKRLLILLLLKIGTPSREIGMALNINSSIVRRMFPVKEIRRIKILK